MTKPSRLHIENNTDYDLVVQPYKQEKGFDWAKAGKATLLGIAAVAAWLPGVGQAVGVAAEAAADFVNAGLARRNYADRIPEGAGRRAALKKITGWGAKIMTPVKFAEALNDNFKYGESTDNLAPKGDAFKLDAGQGRYIVGQDTRPGIKNGIKDIITGITLKSGEAGIDLGRFAIDNPHIGRSKAFYAPQGAKELDQKSDTGIGDYSLDIPYTNLAFTFKPFDEQYDLQTNQVTMTWGLYINQNGPTAIDLF